MGEAEIVERILRARDHQERVPPPSEAGALTIPSAYAVQDRIRETLMARGEQVVGWKAGLTNPAAQHGYGVSEPVCGFLLGRRVFASGCEVPVSGFVEVVVEAEVAFRMKQDLAGPGVTPDRALGAVEGAFPALELVDFRFGGKPTAADLVADGVFASGIVLGVGPVSIAELELSLEGLVYEQNGAIVATNTAAEVMGSPANSLAWMANHLGARGLRLRAGDLVMSGSVSLLLRPKAGDTARARFTHLGSVSVRLV